MLRRMTRSAMLALLAVWFAIPATGESGGVDVLDATSYAAITGTCPEGWPSILMDISTGEKKACVVTTWTVVGSADVSGPSSATDNAIVLFNSTTGKLIKQADASPPTVDTSGRIWTTTTGQGQMNISAGLPRFRFWESDQTDQNATVRLSTNWLSILKLSGDMATPGSDGNEIARIHIDAPDGTFAIDSAGEVGIGTIAPEGNLEIKDVAATLAAPQIAIEGNWASTDDWSIYVPDSGGTQPELRIGYQGPGELAGGGADVARNLDGFHMELRPVAENYFRFGFNEPAPQAGLHIRTGEQFKTPVAPLRLDVDYGGITGTIVELQHGQALSTQVFRMQEDWTTDPYDFRMVSNHSLQLQTVDVNTLVKLRPEGFTALTIGDNGRLYLNGNGAGAGAGGSIEFEGDTDDGINTILFVEDAAGADKFPLLPSVTGPLLIYSGTGTDPPATCSAGSVYIDTDGSTTSTTCTGGQIGVVRTCYCIATDTWLGG